MSTAKVSALTVPGDDEDAGRHMAERANSLEQVRKKLRSGWRNDDAVLNQYFQSCFTNWKVYKGKRTPQQVVKLQAIYKQAIYGDNTEAPPERLDTKEGIKWVAWQRLAGMPQEMAKRRFITFLSEIDPILIDVMPDEKPPIGFPLDRQGNLICAKCNTKVGCLRPLLDQNKGDLREQLFGSDALHDPKRFRDWVRNALANQRCIWGVHKAISRAESKQFTAWFERDENRGFYAYDSISVMLLIHELIHHHHEVAYEMMHRRDEVDPFEYNAQAIRTQKLKEVYEELSGEEFIFYVPCERDNVLCDQRRNADGGKNHTHPAEIDPPTSTNLNTMEEAVELRIQCQKLGINPATGVVTDIAQRCEIYRTRIAHHFEALQAAAVAKIRNEKRHLVHAAEKQKVKELSRNMLAKQCHDVCQMNMVEGVLQIVHRGCNPNEESPRGMTPLITLVLNDAQIEKIEELLTLKANINAVNRFGLSSLMYSCRLNNTKMVHMLMRNQASALQKDDKVGRTALHWCVVHGCEEMVKIIVEYLKEGVGDSLRVTRFLDAQTLDGETALMLAARLRNGLMCYTLISLGSNPNMRNNKGRTAAYLARQHTWGEVADWLDKKVGAGLNKVETFSDMQFEKQHRFGQIKIKDLIHNFGKAYLTLMQNRIGLHPLGCPFVSKDAINDRGDRALQEQRAFMDNHHHHILKRKLEDYLSGKTTAEEEHASMTEMRTHVTDMLTLLRGGNTNPNTELEPKPLAWTPLMCAVAMGEVRTIKLMIREGANPNHPNMYGTTAVMLAAQLQNVEALAELLLHKGSLDAVDSEGYSVASYATSLPLPTLMDRDIVGVLMDGDTDGPKHMTSMDLIRLALLPNGLKDLKEVMTQREASAKPEALDLHFKVLILLEKYGLTNVHSERNVHDQVKSSAWRVEDPTLFEHHVDQEEVEAEKERQNKALYQRLKRKASEDARAMAKSSQDIDLRCPVCTLQVPCAHFFKPEILKQFLLKKAEEARRIEAGEALEIANGSPKKRKKYISKKQLRIANRIQELLTEAHLADRDTDRSTLLVKQFRGREKQVDEEKRNRVLLLEAQRRAEEEEALRLENGEESDEDEEEEDGTPAIEDKQTREEEQKNPSTQDADAPNQPISSASEGNFPEEGSTTPTESKIPPISVTIPPQGSRLRSVKRLPAKKDLERGNGEQNVAAEGRDDLFPPAPVPAQEETSSSSELVVVSDENAVAIIPTEETQLVVVPSTELVEVGETSQALVVQDEFSAPSSALVPLKSALKMVHRPDPATGSTALVEYKKKRRVKFYFTSMDDSGGEKPLAITNGEEIAEGTLYLDNGALDSDFEGLAITDDASFSSGSTLSSAGDPHLSVLITAQSAPVVQTAPVAAGAGGIAMTEESNFPVQKTQEGEVTVHGGGDEASFFADIETVSTSSTTVTTPVGADGYAAPIKHISAGDALSTVQNGELPDHLKVSKLVNPVPINDRRVFMFTKNTMDRKGKTDGLLYVPPSGSPSVASNALVTRAATPPAKKKKSGKKAPQVVRVQRSEPLKVQISGWIFVSLSDIQSEVNPLDSVSISLEMWGSMLESIREKMFDEWMPDLRLEPAVSVKTWQPLAPRCTVCAVGYVRFRSTIAKYTENPVAYLQQHGAQQISRSDENTSTQYLCLACAVRKELFQQSKQYFPANTRNANQQVALPFMHRRNVKASTLPEATYSFLTGATGPSAGAVAAAQGQSEDSSPENVSPPGKPHPSGLDGGASMDSVSVMSWDTGLGTNHPSNAPTPIFENTVLALLPGPAAATSLQLAQSSSPVKSQRLLELDTQEIWERQHLAEQPLQMYEDDLSSIQSTGSMFSSVSGSIMRVDKDSEGNSVSVASTATLVNPAKKPKELALLPFLIAKGHFEEAERTLRIALGKHAVDEGEGLKVLVTLLTLQAEMYKAMGLWPLALAIYFDCVDMNASLMGFQDSATLASMVLLVACLRKMQCVQLAGKYIKAFCTMVENETLKSMRAEIVDKIKEQDSLQVKEFLNHNSVWTEQLKPHVPARNPLQRRFQSVVGMGGFYSLLTSQDGFSVVARVAFYQFCEDIDATTLGKFARFVESCFRLRLCDEPQMYKYLIQNATQKQLAKALVSQSEVARLYREVTSRNHIDLVIDFLNYGVQPSVAVFDALLKIALEKLLKVYRIFLLFEPAGAVLREQRVDIIAEAYEVSALMIQCVWRRKVARDRADVRRAARREAEEEHAKAVEAKRRRAARY